MYNYMSNFVYLIFVYEYMYLYYMSNYVFSMLYLQILPIKS